jgi:2-hydroxy-4-carboxymuconate semialdehyde hemiacetal dehydrogenase
VRIAVAGAGAFGIKHLDALSRIEDVTIAAVVSRTLEQAEQVADRYGAPVASTDLVDVLELPDVDAVILSTPTQLHAAQTLETLAAGKHVQVEIPVADSLADALRVRDAAESSGLVCMVGHTRRFNPSHQWIHQRIQRGELSIQQMDVQTYFFRRTNTNALGNPRSWVDNLLWHHAAHTVDLFAYQCGEPIVAANVLAGPPHPTLGIPMDMSIQLKTARGQLCTLSLSFNNEGPLGTFFRYICDSGTYLARYDDLFSGNEDAIDVSKVAVSNDGIELQDREFVRAIRDGDEPNSSINSVIGCYEVLGALQASLDQK